MPAIPLVPEETKDLLNFLLQMCSYQSMHIADQGVHVPRVKCSTIEMYYEIVGSGKPLLLLHGLGGDIRSWDKVVSYLSASLQLIRVDLPGSGQSANPKDTMTIEGMAASVAQAIEALGYQRLDVAGFSMGGCVAISLALDHARVVDRLALIATIPASSQPSPFTRRAEELFSQTVITPSLLKKIYELTYGEKHRQRCKAEDFIRSRMDDPYPQSTRAYIAQLEALKRFDRAADVDRITARTLLVAGGADNVLSPGVLARLAEKIPSSSLRILDGIGHMVLEEAPEQLAQSLLTL